jgi:hypothetical protein
MNAPDTSHPLAPDLVLLAPPTFVVRSTVHGLSAIEQATGSSLSVLLKASASGTPDDERLLQSALALLQKKHSGAERIGVPTAIQVGVCRGRSASLRAATPSGTSIEILITTLIVPDPENAAQQRNLIVVLEVPTPVFELRPAFYQRFAQHRLQIGAAPGAPVLPRVTPLVLELAPLEEPAAPEPAAARTESPAALPPAPPQKALADVGPARRVPRVVVSEPDDDELLASAARGQRTLAISILLTFVARAIGNVPDVPLLMAYAISAAVLFYAISGVLRICSGFRYSMNHKLVLMLCSSIPLVGIICWVYLSVRTTRRLRAAGFQVGLFGVRS